VIRTITTGIRCGAGRVRRCNSEISTFRTQLNTRRLMPVRLRGYQHEDANAEGRIFGRFNEMWYLEPCPRPSQTKSGGLRSTIFRRGTTSRRSTCVIRRESPDLLSGVLHGGFVGFDSSRPAMNLLVTLLWEDFKVWNWVSGVPNLFNFNKSVISYQTLSTGSSPIPRRSRG
jgi:hypothetical protein